MENYDLSWQLHNEEALRAIQELRSSGSLTDTSLYCENQLFRVHGLVLAACSSYFERILVSLPSASKETVIALPKISLNLLRLAIDFMYSGKVTVPSDDLVAFMDVAEILEIRGLRSKRPKRGLDEEEEERATISVSGDEVLETVDDDDDEEEDDEDDDANANPGVRSEGKRRASASVDENEVKPAKMGKRASSRGAKSLNPLSNAEITSSGYRDDVELKEDCVFELEGTDNEDDDDIALVSNGLDDLQKLQIPQNIPAALAGAEHIERMGYSIWRGQSQASTGRRLTYFCSMCDYVSEQKCNAMRHEIKHSQIRPYECNICGKAYTENRGLKRHRLSAHPNVDDGNGAPLSHHHNQQQTSD